MIKVSVIIPIYNVEQYLPRCLDSVLNQTLKDIEVICVDDGSTDKSGKIADDYARSDSRVRVLHRANAGYGASMNVGLDIAKGRYIGIVESDDCVLPEMFQTLYAAAEKEELDLVKSDAYFWIESAGFRQRIHYKWLDGYYGRVLEEWERRRAFDFFMNIWTGIYRKDFLREHEIRFHESPGASYQDNGFWLQTMVFYRRAMWIDDAFYLYRQDNPEASVKNPGKIKAMTREYEYVEELFDKKNEKKALWYCHFYRMFRHKGTFLRVADENKRAFCNMIIADYDAYGECLVGNPVLAEWFEHICMEPDYMCNRFIGEKRQIQKRLEEAETIVIYGAGLHGSNVFRTLYNEGYEKKISCFAVTKEGEGSAIAGRKVLGIGEAVEKYPSALIIVAVAPGNVGYKQMKACLCRLGVSAVMDGSDVEKYFYVLF